MTNATRNYSGGQLPVRFHNITDTRHRETGDPIPPGNRLSIQHDDCFRWEVVDRVTGQVIPDVVLADGDTGLLVQYDLNRLGRPYYRHGYPVTKTTRAPIRFQRLPGC